VVPPETSGVKPTYFAAPYPILANSEKSMESNLFGPATSCPLTPTLSRQGRGGNGGILSPEGRRSEIAAG